MLTKLVIHLLLVIKNLRWFYDKWSISRRDELLHFLIVSVNYVLEKGGHSDWGLDGILWSNCMLIWWFWAELKVWKRACQKSFNSIYDYPLNWFASMTSNLCFLTKFIRSQGLLFLDVISWIFSSKKDFLVFLTAFLNIFQSEIDLDE